AACPALIGPRGIYETVANHPLAIRQGGFDQPGNVIGSGGCEQQSFRLSPPALAGRVQEQFADRLGPRGAAGFARAHHFKPAGFERFAQQPGLGGLACPFPPFEADEMTPCHEISPTMPLATRSSTLAWSMSSAASSGTS